MALLLACILWQRGLGDPHPTALQLQRRLAAVVTGQETASHATAISLIRELTRRGE